MTAITDMQRDVREHRLSARGGNVCVPSARTAIALTASDADRHPCADIAGPFPLGVAAMPPLPTAHDIIIALITALAVLAGVMLYL